MCQCLHGTNANCINGIDTQMASNKRQKNYNLNRNFQIKSIDVIILYWITDSKIVLYVSECDSLMKIFAKFNNTVFGWNDTWMLFGVGEEEEKKIAIFQKLFWITTPVSF